jgi:glycosyltransferase involved in cell wall biosynthesis
VIHAAEEYVDEIIVVDDGSIDQTSKLAKRAGAVVLRHETNKGKTAAVQTLINEAMRRDADVLVLLDADGQHDPEEIPALIKAVVEDGYDLATGSRKLKESKKRGRRPFIRPLGQFVLKVCLGTITRNRYSDPECGFRALSRRAMEVMKFKGKGFSVEAEMIRLAEEHHLKTIEVPITEIYVKGGSTLNPWRHGFGNLGTLISWISEKRPLLFVGLPSLVLILIGFFFGLLLLQQYNRFHYFSMPYTMLAGFFIVIGTLAVFMSLVLNVISRLAKK